MHSPQMIYILNVSVFNCTEVLPPEIITPMTYSKPQELIPSTHQSPSPFKSLPQKGSSCRKDLPYPRIVPAVNDRFRERQENGEKIIISLTQDMTSE